jgi:hypothetical protein
MIFIMQLGLAFALLLCLGTVLIPSDPEFLGLLERVCLIAALANICVPNTVLPTGFAFKQFLCSHKKHNETHITKCFFLLPL